MREEVCVGYREESRGEREVERKGVISRGKQVV